MFEWNLMVSTAQKPTPVESRPQQIGIAIVLHEGKALIGIRGTGSVLAGKHEFPGGKCEPGESVAACAIRECYEETGLRVEIDETFLTTHHSYPHGEVDLSFFLCRPADGVRIDSLLGSFRWVSVSELAGLNFPQGNMEALAKLIDRSFPGRRTA